MAKYRKKPVVIEAVQVPTDIHANKLWDECIQFLMRDRFLSWSGGNRIPGFMIKTLEGEMLASPGDWIIRGAKGEFYPCKPDIFEATYDRAD